MSTPFKEHEILQAEFIRMSHSLSRSELVTVLRDLAEFRTDTLRESIQEMMLSSNDRYSLRLACAYTLACWHSDNTAVREILECALRSEPEDQVFGAVGLLRLGEETVIPLLRQLLDTWAFGIVDYAADALLAVGDETVKQQMIALLNDPADRCSGAGPLGRAGYSLALPALIEMMTSEDRVNRFFGVKSVWPVADDCAVDLLKKCCSDKNGAVRRSAYQSLAHLVLPDERDTLLLLSWLLPGNLRISP